MLAINLTGNSIRYDLQIIASWIESRSRVLGLGCGDGELLYYLKTRKQSDCTGIEIDEAKVVKCVERGLNVLQGDINKEVGDYPTNRFDYVILSQTLQQIYDPANLIRAILRIGKRAIVSFPNFSHWKIRSQLLLTGRAPVSVQLPYQWHNTPNIRVITIKDFRNYAKEVGFKIIKEIAIDTSSENKFGKIVHFLPEWRATYGIFLIGQ